MSSNNDIDTLARTCWGEARGEGLIGMEAVANVVLNRVAARRWPNTIAGVCLQPRQFSAWNRTDPNRARMLRVTISDQQFKQALDIADRAADGRLADRTNGADHFHTNAVRPSWSRNARPVATIGRHIFFRLG
jgi:spore germination cell wall hydrolase CwlJ-like protein